VPLCRCKAVESHSLCIVLRNTFTDVKHDAQVALSLCMPLCRCKAVESHSLRIVLRNTLTIIVPHSNYILPETAARSLALPSQRQSFPYVCSNTFAKEVAAAECALAVRAAQRRASFGQLERSLFILGNARSAVNQHVREKRVRGGVLRQRRLPRAASLYHCSPYSRCPSWKTESAASAAAATPPPGCACAGC